uniref:Putative nitrogen permease regulator 2-like protein-like isoform 1 n=1 Tax=Amblyomma triste TaxID=251400 RepID=A0A023G1E1_AMBTT
MLYYGIVQLIPLFLYSAVYATTPEIRTLATDTVVQKECISYVARQGRPRPTFRSIFEMYCSFHHSNSVRDVCARTNPHSLGIDERKLVQYGVMKGLLRRLHKYPIDLKRSGDNATKSKPVAKYFDGAHSYDDICAKTGEQAMFYAHSFENKLFHAILADQYNLLYKEWEEVVLE